MNRILIVDDEPTVRKGLAFIIEQFVPAWVQVAQADSAAEALRMLQADEYHLILTDIHMPDMDGLQFIAEVRRIEPDMHTIIISGYNDFDYTRRAIQLHCLDYVMKPVKREDLQAIVGRILDIWNKDSQQKKTRSETEELADHYRFLRLMNGEFDTLSEMYECAAVLGLHPNVPVIGLLILRAEQRANQLPLYLFAREFFQERQASVYRVDSHEVMVVMRHDNEEEERFQRSCVERAEQMLKVWTELSRPKFFASFCLLRDVAECPSCRMKAAELLEETQEWLVVHVFKPDRLSRRETKDPAIRRAKQIIEEAYGQELSASRLAATVHLSADYFSWLFHREVGKTYTEYITEIRMERAKQLLQLKDIPAYEIAEKIGYQSVRNFNRVFKAWVGQSPIQYRKMFQANVQTDPS